MHFQKWSIFAEEKEDISHTLTHCVNTVNLFGQWLEVFLILLVSKISLFFFVKCKDWEFKYVQAIEFTCYWTWQCIVKIIAKHMSFHFLLICLYKLFGRRIYYKSAVNFWPIEFTSIHYQLYLTRLWVGSLIIWIFVYGVYLNISHESLNHNHIL